MICQRLHGYKIPQRIQRDFSDPPFNYTEWDNFLDNKCRNEGQIYEGQIEKLDRIIKGCLQINPDDRPAMDAIVRFMEGECDGFNYERDRAYRNVQVWCEEEVQNF